MLKARCQLLRMLVACMLERADLVTTSQRETYEWHPSSARLVEPLVYLPNTSSPSSTLPVTARRNPTLYDITASMLLIGQ